MAGWAVVGGGDNVVGGGGNDNGCRSVTSVTSDLAVRQQVVDLAVSSKRWRR